MLNKIRLLFANFRLRKRLLAVADACIVVFAGLVANVPLPLLAERIGRPDLIVIFALTVLTCFGSLIFMGAYNKLWRYFSKKDYLSCIYGCLLGMFLGYFLLYLTTEKVFIEFQILHFIVATFGICAFRYLFKDAFMVLLKTGIDEAHRKRTMIIGAGSASLALLREF